jgi:hypothetical protein
MACADADQRDPRPTWLDECSEYIKRIAVDPEGREWVEWRAPEWTENDADQCAAEGRAIHGSPEFSRAREERSGTSAEALNTVIVQVPPGTTHVLAEAAGTLVSQLTTVQEAPDERHGVKMLRVERGRTINPF